MARISSVVIYFAGLISLAFSGTHVIKDGDYVLGWSIGNGNVTVTAIVKTTGYVGFGISPYGNMMEADIIFSGRRANGDGYIQDSYAFADSGPVRDRVQNVELLTTTENSTHTSVTFTRKLDTGDVDEDQPILNATQYIIWAWGPTDNLQYHGPNRGTVSLNLVSSA